VCQSCRGMCWSMYCRCCQRAPFCAHEPCAGVVRALLGTQLGSLSQLWFVQTIQCSSVLRFCHHGRHLTIVDTSPCGLLDPSSPSSQNSLWLYPRTVAQLVGSLMGSEFCRLICLYLYISSKNYAGLDPFTSCITSKTYI